MALKFPGLKSFSGIDAKSRIFLLFAAVVSISLLVYLTARYLSGGSSSVQSVTASAPRGLVSVPGGEVTAEYERTVREANARNLQETSLQPGSAVIGTVLNVAGSNNGGGEAGCYMCPSEDNPQLGNDIETLMDAGKLSKEDADTLKKLMASNASVDEFAASLDALVKSGKLTPEQARALLEKFKKQHTNALINESAKSMDAMIKAGRLSLNSANELLDLQKRKLSPAEYAAELARLVREGKLSKEAAAELLAQYTQQQAKEDAKESVYAIKQMTKAGQITPETEKVILDLQSKNVPLNEYRTTINRLVEQGKITPAVAAKLISQYETQHTGGIGGDTGAIAAALTAKENALAKLRQLAASKQISPDVAAELEALQLKNASVDQYAAALQKSIATGKVNPKVAAQLLDDYKIMRAAINAAGPMGALIEKGGAAVELAKRLLNLQANNATSQAYADELKRAVQAGLIKPEEASALLQQYQAIITPISGSLPSVENSSAAFLDLQERVRAGSAPAPASVEQFQNIEVVTEQPSQQAQAQNDDQERQKRLEALFGAMNNQANQLISAWVPATMAHQQGSPPAQKPDTGAGSGSTSGGKGGLGDKTEIEKTVLIKAGTIYFGVLDTAVNSDYPDTPVMVTIIEGKHKGAKLLGKLSLAQGKDKVSLNFNLMDEDDWTSAKAVNAFAIDPDTARTVMASDVDNHYFERYGFMMATAFIQGYSSAITNAGTSTTGVFGTSTSHPELSPSNKFAVGLGQIGTNLAAVAQDKINMPATVTINAGVGLGILFSAELTE